jgi:hypothetical protein
VLQSTNDKTKNEKKEILLLKKYFFPLKLNGRFIFDLGKKYPKIKKNL